MAFLTIRPLGGGTEIEIEVQTGSASESEPKLVGADHEMFDGSTRSTVRAEMARFGPWTSGPLAQADYLAIRDMTNNGKFVEAFGDALNGASSAAPLVARVLIGDRGYIPNGLGFFRIVTVRVNQAQ